jgi:hypothetical protein
MDGGFNSREQEVRHLTNSQPSPCIGGTTNIIQSQPVHGSTGPPLARFQRINRRCELDLRLAHVLHALKVRLAKLVDKI